VTGGEHEPEVVETIRAGWRVIRILRCRRCHEPLYDIPRSA